MRGKAGIFLAFQYPQAIAGVSVLNFLRQALSARKGIDLSVLELRLSIMEWMERLDMDPAFADRYLNEGFSGGEKKRNEILQMAILEPELAILDETDSGLDIDALKVVAKGVQEVRAERPELGVLAITHYQRLLDHLQPDRVHILDRRPHRRVRRPRAGRAPRARGLRGVPMSASIRSTSPRSRRTSRSSTREVNGQPPRLPRLGVVVAEAAGRCSTRWSDFYETTYANVHRGVYAIADEATERLRGRPRQGRPLHRRADRPRGRLHQERHRGASTSSPTRGAGPTSRAGDAVLLTEMEHHANIVPVADAAPRSAASSCAASRVGRRLHARPDRPRPARRRREARVGHRHVERARHAHPGAPHSPTPPTPPARWCSSTPPSTCPHLPTDVQALGADFFGFTGHKMLGPTGIGVLWAREELLEAMPPFLGGGEMIRDVRLDGWTPNEIPWKFEAGTPPIAEAVGLGAAVDYLDGARHGRRPRARGRAHRLRAAHAHRALRRRHHASTARPSRPQRGGVLSFAFRDVHPHDISQVLDEHGVCVRAGHHCAKPLMRRLGVGATARASFYVYNDEADVDALADALDATE